MTSFRVAFLVLIVVVVCDGRCPAGALQGLGDDDCYTVVLGTTSDKTWKNAAADCKKNGGRLASIPNALSNSIIRQPFVDKLAVSDYWAGGSSDAKGTWTWSDGTNFTYTNWATGHPRKTRNLCLAPSASSGQWYSTYCDSYKPYICKVPSMSSTCPGQASTSVPTVQPTPFSKPRCAFGYDYVKDAHVCLKIGTTDRQDGSLQWYQYWCSAWGGAKGANQVSIHSAKANKAITEYARSSTNLPKGSTAIWTGLSAPNGTWTWTDGSPFDYATWVDPKVAFKHCTGFDNRCAVAVQLDEKNSGQWDGYDYYYFYPILCATKPNY